jgi:hypothetical protein
VLASVVVVAEKHTRAKIFIKNYRPSSRTCYIVDTARSISSAHLAHKAFIRCVLYQLRHRRQIRRGVGQDVTTRLWAQATSRLDYCNSVLANQPQSTIEPQQRVLSAVARLIFDLGLRAPVTPCSLIRLHRGFL